MLKEEERSVFFLGWGWEMEWGWESGEDRVVVMNWEGKRICCIGGGYRIYMDFNFLGYEVLWNSVLLKVFFCIC